MFGYESKLYITIIKELKFVNINTIIKWYKLFFYLFLYWNGNSNGPTRFLSMVSPIIFLWAPPFSNQTTHPTRQYIPSNPQPSDLTPKFQIPTTRHRLGTFSPTPHSHTVVRSGGPDRPSIKINGPDCTNRSRESRPTATPPPTCLRAVWRFPASCRPQRHVHVELEIGPTKMENKK